MYEGKRVASRETDAHHHLESEAVVAARAIKPVRQTFGDDTYIYQSRSECEKFHRWGYVGLGCVSFTYLMLLYRWPNLAA